MASILGAWVGEEAVRGSDGRGAGRPFLTVSRADGGLAMVVAGGDGARVELRVPDPDVPGLLAGLDRDRLVIPGPDGRPLAFRRVRDDVKQVIVYRRDLNMRKGKIAAQVAHASMRVLLQRDEGPWDRLEIPLEPAMAAWCRARFAKVVLSVEDEPALLEVHRLAGARGLPCALVTDAGHTEFHGVPTRTTVAIGPAPAADLDAITGPDGLVPTKLA